MSPLKRFWLAAVAGPLLLSTGCATDKCATDKCATDKLATESPVRAVYVTEQDGNPRVMYVTGTVPPEKLPTIAPVAPSNVPPPNRVVPAAPRRATPPAPARVVPVRRDTPAQRPAIAPVPAAAAPLIDSAPFALSDASSAKSGYCGPSCQHGATSSGVSARTTATVPPPLGSSVRSAYDTQRENALAEYFVLHREDWLDARTDLNDTGARHLDGIIRRFGMIGSPVKVEPTGNADLDQKRVTAVIAKLAATGIPAQEAASRVTLGTSRAEGLR